MQVSHIYIQFYKGFKFVQIALSVKTVFLKFIVDILTVISTSHLIIETGYIEITKSRFLYKF